jgi:hypothetical protein
MRKRYLFPIFCLAMLLVITGCGKKKQEESQQQPSPDTAEESAILKMYPMDSMAGIITQPDEHITMEIDPKTSTDGNGSLMIEVNEPATIRLYEVGDLDVENARLTYRAKLRTEFVDGRVYLEMWCHFPQAGEFYSRGLAAALTGTTKWVTVETPFLLKAGENPDNIKLNLVFDGSGTAWIDDIQLIVGPLQ